MEYNTDLEKLFYLYTLKHPKYFEKVYPNFFKSKELKILFNFSKKFFEKFKESTSRDQVKSLIRQTKHKDEIEPEVVDQAFDADLREYDEEWLEGSLKGWIQYQSLQDSLITAIEYVKSNVINTDNISSIVSKVKSIVDEKNNVNFDNSFGVNFANPEDHIFDPANKMASGKRFYDRISNGGFDRKTLTVYAGQQNAGKCLIYNMMLKIKNKNTNEILEISIGDLFEKIKRS